MKGMEGDEWQGLLPLLPAAILPGFGSHHLSKPWLDPLANVWLSISGASEAGHFALSQHFILENVPRLISGPGGPQDQGQAGLNKVANIFKHATGKIIRFR